MFVEIRVWLLRHGGRATAMAKEDVSTLITKIPYFLGLMRAVVIGQQDSPIATFGPGFQMPVQECYDVFLTKAALRSHSYCEPVWISATATKCLQTPVDTPIFVRL